MKISVAVHMDDLWEEDDLIYDAVWEAFREEIELEDEMIDRVRESACFYDISDCVVETEEFPRDASFEDICEAIDHLEAQAETSSEEMFKRLCEIVKDCFKAACEEAVWKED